MSVLRIDFHYLLKHKAACDNSLRGNVTGTIYLYYYLQVISVFQGSRIRVR